MSDLRNIRTCRGCRAFNFDAECEFGFNIEVSRMVYNLPISFRPTEPCTKQTTMKGLMNELENRREKQ